MGRYLPALHQIRELIEAAAPPTPSKDAHRGITFAATEIQNEIAELIYGGNKDAKSEQAHWGRKLLLEDEDLFNGFMDIIQALNVWSEDNNILRKTNELAPADTPPGLYQGYLSQAGEATARFAGALAADKTDVMVLHREPRDMSDVHPDPKKQDIASDIVGALQKWDRGTTNAEAMVLGIHDPGELKAHDEAQYGKPSREELEARINLYNGVWQIPPLEVLFQMRTMLKRRAEAESSQKGPRRSFYVPNPSEAYLQMLKDEGIPHQVREGGKAQYIKGQRVGNLTRPVVDVETKRGRSKAADLISGLMMMRDVGHAFH